MAVRLKRMHWPSSAAGLPSVDIPMIEIEFWRDPVRTGASLFAFRRDSPIQSASSHTAAAFSKKP